MKLTKVTREILEAAIIGFGCLLVIVMTVVAGGCTDNRRALYVPGVATYAVKLTDPASKYISVRHSGSELAYMDATCTVGVGSGMSAVLPCIDAVGKCDTPEQVAVNREAHAVKLIIHHTGKHPGQLCNDIEAKLMEDLK